MPGTVSITVVSESLHYLRLGEATSSSAAKGALKSVARAAPAGLIARAFDLSLAALLTASERRRVSRGTL
jgi:hypothetical protein